MDPFGGLVGDLKRALQQAVMPMLLGALLAYFAWHAIEGQSGFRTMQLRERQIAAAQAELAEAASRRDAAERRVQALRAERLDLDTLEERARAMLNLVGRDEIVILYGPGGRLY
jgi:cell division protein FtsB